MFNSLYEMCLGVLHYISLYALILHSILAHHWVPFSLGVSQNKRTSTLQINKLKVSLHITQTETYLYLLIIYLHMSKIDIKFYLSEPCVDRPSICVKPSISSFVPQQWWISIRVSGKSEPLNLAYNLYRYLNMMCHFLISYPGVVLWMCMFHFLVWCKMIKEI